MLRFADVAVWDEHQEKRLWHLEEQLVSRPAASLADIIARVDGLIAMHAMEGRIDHMLGSGLQRLPKDLEWLRDAGPDAYRREEEDALRE